MAEEQEALQFMFQCGQYVIAPAKELVTLAMRHVMNDAFRIAKIPIDGAVNGVVKGTDVLFSRIDGIGSYGCVTYKFLTKSLRKRGDQLAWYDLPVDMERKDLRELAEECRRRRVSFSVYNTVDGSIAMVYGAKDAETIERAIGDIFDRYVERDVAEQNAKRADGEPEINVRAEQRRRREDCRANTPYSPAEQERSASEDRGDNWVFRFHDEDWQPYAEENAPANTKSFKIATEDDEGNVITRIARSDGSFLITLETPGGGYQEIFSDIIAPCAGDSIQGAMQCATAYIKGNECAEKIRAARAKYGPGLGEDLKVIKESIARKEKTRRIAAARKRMKNMKVSTPTIRR